MTQSARRSKTLLCVKSSLAAGSARGGTRGLPLSILISMPMWPSATMITREGESKPSVFCIVSFIHCYNLLSIYAFIFVSILDIYYFWRACSSLR